MPDISELIADGFDTVKADVQAQLKAHPQYSQIVDAAVAKVVQALIASVA